MRESRKKIRHDRLWRQFTSFIGEPIFHRDLSKWPDYNPEPFRDAFFRYESHGAKALTASELEGIWPLICAKKNLTNTINMLVEETFDWDSKGWGWIYPLSDTLRRKGELDRLTRLALLKIMRALKRCRGSFERLEWYLKHPAREFSASAFDSYEKAFRMRFSV